MLFQGDMKWVEWFRKLAVGSLTTAAAGIIAYLIAVVTNLVQEPGTPALVVLIGPVVLHVLGMLANLVKHI